MSRQLLVRSPNTQNNVTTFLYETSLFEVRISLPPKEDIEEKEGIRLLALASALIACSPGFFSVRTMDARAALSMVRDASGILTRLLEGGRSTIAGRLAGAFRNVGRERIADDIVKTMQAAGYDIRENDPFTDKLPLIASAREVSPHVNRIRLMWQHMREPILENFPKEGTEPFT